MGRYLWGGLWGPALCVTMFHEVVLARDGNHVYPRTVIVSARILEILPRFSSN